MTEQERTQLIAETAASVLVAVQEHMTTHRALGPKSLAAIGERFGVAPSTGGAA